RKAKRSGELLDVLSREQAMVQEPSRQVTLHLELARLKDSPGEGSQAALEHYRAAIELDLGNAPALAGLERISRRDGKWDVLAEVLRKAPRTPRTLRSLGEALEKLEQWKELADIRRIELELTEDPKEAARIAVKLAQLVEERLGDPEQAVRFYRR